MSNDELIRALRQALEQAPLNPALHKHLADLLKDGHRFIEAIQEYRLALGQAPQDAEIKAGLAEVYYLNDQPDVAAMIVEELLRAPNPSAKDYLLGARVFLKTGEVEQAGKAYQQAVAREPTLADPALEKMIGQAPVKVDQPNDKKSGSIMVPAQPDSETPFMEVSRPVITFNDVGGMDRIKEEVRLKIIYPLSHPELYAAYGKKTGGGILMYGPPGCGKTYLARATAGEVKSDFLSVGLHDVLDMWLGQSEMKLHMIFETARRHAPCVLFFDEADALGASRSDMRYTSYRQVVAQFLSEMDSVDSSNEGVLIMAATNAPWQMDAALRRPGRFDRVIFVPPPDLAARRVILALLLAGKPLEQIDYDQLAQNAENFSGADLKGLIDQVVEDKLREAIRLGRPSPITNREILAMLKQARPTTTDWFLTARNYATYANEGGLYDDVLTYLKSSKSIG